MRIVLVTGPDGPAISTLAAATAIRCAHRGTKVRLVELFGDGAVSDVLGQDSGGVEPVSGLRLGSIDPHEAVARRLSGLGSSFWPAVSDRPAVSDWPAVSDRPEVWDWPGLGDLGVLLAVRDVVREAATDVLVVDAGPTTGLLRFMSAVRAAPAAIDLALPRVAGLTATETSTRSSSTGLSSTWQSLVRSVGSALGVPTVTGWASLLAVLTELSDDVRGVLEILGDPVRCTVQYVLPANAFGASRMRRAVPLLALQQLPVAEVIEVGQDDEALGPIRRELTTPAWRTCPRLPTEAGVPGLAALVDTVWTDGADPADGTVPAAERACLGPHAEQDGEHFVLVLPLPLVDASTVTAGRRGDALEVRIGQHRGVLPLSPVLRRCSIVGGGVRNGALRVRFRPDPAHWPTGLS